MTQVLDTADLYLSAFERLLREAGDREPEWLRHIRRAAIAHFTEMGFPTTDQEEWRFTPVHPIAQTPFAPASRVHNVTAGQIARFIPEGLLSSRLVFVNGFYAPDLSALLPMPKSVEAHPLEKVLASAPEAIEHYLARYARHDNHPFAALNTAFLRDGACVYVPHNIVLESPLHLIFVSTGAVEPTVSHPRNLIVAGENSQFTLIESYVGLDGGTYFTNAVTEIVVGENAFVDHYRVQQESRTASHMSTLHIHIERNANFSSHVFVLGGGIARNDITAVMNDEGIECTLNGLYLVDGQRLIDNHTALDHAKPHCSSHQLYKGILSERGRGVFNGKIYVRPDAQKTDAKQTNQALLLSDDAQINTKPQLEIFADDVKCTHGATVGQLDADALFYLRTRGIGQEDARNLLIHAFAGDIISRVKVEPLREYLDRTLYELLPG